jgi:hypothetical protein
VAVNPLIILLLAGAGGGLIQWFLGYKAQETDEDFEWVKFAQTLLVAILGGAVIAMSAEPMATARNIMTVILGAAGFEGFVNRGDRIRRHNT